MALKKPLLAFLFTSLMVISVWPGMCAFKRLIKQRMNSLISWTDKNSLSSTPLLSRFSLPMDSLANWPLAILAVKSAVSRRDLFFLNKDYSF